MAVTSTTKSTKVVLKLAEGSQTIGNVRPTATDENIYALGNAVSKLCNQRCEEIIKVVETTLADE